MHLQTSISKPDRKPRFVLLYGTLETGGIETLIVRMANYLSSAGYSVTVCYNRSGPMLDLFGPGVETLHFTDTPNLLKQANVQLRPSPVLTAIVSFDPISAARGLLLELQCGRTSPARHITGVFHPRAYFMTEERRDRARVNELVGRAVGTSSIFFMNEESRVGHASRWQTDLNASPVITLPIDEVARRWTPPPSSPAGALRVISVGRLVDFKAYNSGAAGVVADCRAKGLDIRWDIFGTGVMQPAIEAEIAGHDVAGEVGLMGELPYARLSDTLVGYDMFVGMGTAALEAAMLGVPTLCAIDSQPRLCYGYLHDLPYGNFGEMRSEPPRRDYADLLRDFAAMDSPARARVSDLCREAARAYSMPVFIQNIFAMLSAGDVRQPSRLRKLLAGQLYRVATESTPMRFARTTRDRIKGRLGNEAS